MRTVLLLNLAVLGMVAWGFGNEYVRNRELQQEIDGLKDSAKSLEVRNLELAALRERFDGNGQMEREARLKLNLMRPGEQVVVITGLGEVPQADQQPAPTVQPGSEEGPGSNPRKWLRYFMRKTAQQDDVYSTQ